MTEQIHAGAVRRLQQVARRRAGTFRRAVQQARQDAGWAGAARQIGTLVAELALRPARRRTERRLDRRLGLDTRADDGAGHAGGPAAAGYDDGVAYSPTPLHHFRHVLRHLPIEDPAGFAFVDLGCGKGRTLFVAAEHGFRPVIGVELDPRLARIARDNIRAFAGAAPSRTCPISVVDSDAIAYRFPAVPTVIFLFNPFGAATLREVVANLDESLRTAPRRVVVAYFNAVHREVLDASATLRPAGNARHWVVYDTKAGPRGDRDLC